MGWPVWHRALTSNSKLTIITKGKSSFKPRVNLESPGHPQSNPYSATLSHNINPAKRRLPRDTEASTHRLAKKKEIEINTDPGERGSTGGSHSQVTREGESRGEDESNRDDFEAEF